MRVELQGNVLADPRRGRDEEVVVPRAEAGDERVGEVELQSGGDARDRKEELRRHGGGSGGLDVFPALRGRAGVLAAGEAVHLEKLAGPDLGADPGLAPLPGFGLRLLVLLLRHRCSSLVKTAERARRLGADVLVLVFRRRALKRLGAQLQFSERPRRVLSDVRVRVIFQEAAE